MGSISNLLNNPNESYILGLWGADKYMRTSSIGLSNTNLDLIHVFQEFLLSRFSQDRIRVRIYGEKNQDEFIGFRKTYGISSKNVHKAYHIYVNSRPLGREFINGMNNRFKLSKQSIYPYFAGRFDGDGSISSGKKRFCRIVYGNLDDASKDVSLLKENDIKISLYQYKGAHTFCIYFSETTLDKFLANILPYSIKLRLPRID